MNAEVEQLNPLKLVRSTTVRFITLHNEDKESEKAIKIDYHDINDDVLASMILVEKDLDIFLTSLKEGMGQLASKKEIKKKSKKVN